jgi:hypothetical protein
VAEPWQEHRPRRELRLEVVRQGAQGPVGGRRLLAVEVVRQQREGGQERQERLELEAYQPQREGELAERQAVVEGQQQRWVASQRLRQQEASRQGQVGALQEALEAVMVQRLRWAGELEHPQVAETDQPRRSEGVPARRASRGPRPHPRRVRGVQPRGLTWPARPYSRRCAQPCG